MKLPERYLFDSSGRPMIVGEMYRHSHEECGDTKDRLYVQRTKSGWLAHCHNCAPNVSGFIPNKENLTPSELLKQIIDPVSGKHKSPRTRAFPSDLVEYLPINALRWLHKYGITAEEIKEHNIGYSPANNKVILPVLDDSGKLALWQERALDHRPLVKYATFFAQGDQKKKPRFKILKGKTTAVLVEDYLSTIKVGRVTDTYCLHGSVIPSDLLAILRGYEEVVIWLDYDKREQARYDAGRLNRLGLKTRFVQTLYDPKTYSEEQINGYLFP